MSVAEDGSEAEEVGDRCAAIWFPIMGRRDAPLSSEQRPGHPTPSSPSLGAMSVLVVLVQTNPTQPNPTDSLSFACTSASQPTALLLLLLLRLLLLHLFLLLILWLLCHPPLATHCYLPLFLHRSPATVLRPPRTTLLQPSQPAQTHLHALRNLVRLPSSCSMSPVIPAAFRYRNLAQSRKILMFSTVQPRNRSKLPALSPPLPRTVWESRVREYPHRRWGGIRFQVTNWYYRNWPNNLPYRPD